VIKEIDIKQAIISAGYTYSGENGDDYPMRNIPLSHLTKTIVDFLAKSGVTSIQREEKYLGKGKRSYYLARADLARLLGNEDLAQSYEKLVGALPLEGHDE